MSHSHPSHLSTLKGCPAMPPNSLSKCSARSLLEYLCGSPTVPVVPSMFSLGARRWSKPAARPPLTSKRLGFCKCRLTCSPQRSRGKLATHQQAHSFSLDCMGRGSGRQCAPFGMSTVTRQQRHEDHEGRDGIDGGGFCCRQGRPIACGQVTDAAYVGLSLMQESSAHPPRRM